MKTLLSGAVASPHWAATEVGLAVLADGGTALDSCIATNGMLGVVYPHMCGVGGDLFLLYFEARTGQVHCLNGSGRAPRLATPEAYRKLGLAAVPVRGPLSAIVPGAVAAWEESLRRFGSRSLAELLQPAIDAADSGLPASERLATWIGRNADTLAQDPWLRDRFLDGKGAPLPPGAPIRLPELARTLEQIGEGGSASFYDGDIAKTIDEAMRAAGGLLRREDMKAHHSDWVAPVRTRYLDLDVITTPPNSQGFVALEMLNILDCLGAASARPEADEYIQALVHAKLAAFADRDRYLGDPEFVSVPTERLLGQEHARASAGRVHAKPVPGPSGGDTVYLCAVDKTGNACSFIQSIYYPFGSGFTAGDTGIVLHNRGHYFSLAAGHPNVLAPGRRTAHTLMASMALRGGRPYLVFGTMGADGQPQTTVQVLQRVLAGAGPQEAVAAPRVLHGRFFLEDDADRLLVESGLGEDAINALMARGYRVELAPALDERMGHAHAIVVHHDGRVEAGADPRSDGTAKLTDE